MEVSLIVVSFIIASFLHFGVQKVFIHYKLFDNINHRSSHKSLATRTGGIGVYITILIISLYFYFKQIELFDYSLFIPLSIMFLIGVYDDIYNADFKLKFFLQIIAAKILIDQGYFISNFYGLFGLYEVPWLLAQSSTVFVFLIVVNAFNFIDGIDGLAITEIIKLTLIIEYFSMENSTISPLGFLIIGSILPLYYYNFRKKKKIFLGDSGSLLLGSISMIYILNVLGKDFNFRPELVLNKTLFAILLLLYPLVDLLRVFSLRIKEGNSPFKADKRHIHHLLQKKLNHFQINILIFSSSVIILILVAELS